MLFKNNHTTTILQKWLGLSLMSTQWEKFFQTVRSLLSQFAQRYVD